MGGTRYYRQRQVDGPIWGSPEKKSLNMVYEFYLKINKEQKLKLRKIFYPYLKNNTLSILLRKDLNK
jgi:hypothetical protein